MVLAKIKTDEFYEFIIQAHDREDAERAAKEGGQELGPFYERWIYPFHRTIKEVEFYEDPNTRPDALYCKLLVAWRRQGKKWVPEPGCRELFDRYLELSNDEV